MLARVQQALARRGDDPDPDPPGGPWKSRIGEFSPARSRSGSTRCLGRFSDPKIRAAVAGTLLHEMVHQCVDADGDHDDNRRHGAKFTAQCNKIGADLGLPEVVHRKPRGQEAELSKHWPHVVQATSRGGGTSSLTEPEPAGDRVGDTWPPPSNPMAVAREIIEDYQTEAGS